MPVRPPVSVMSGFSALLRINDQDIGVATNVGWNEDTRMQPIECLNNYGPLDHKTTGWQCQVTTGIYILDTEAEEVTQQTRIKKKIDVLTIALVDMEILNNDSGVTKDQFKNCRTSARNVAYAANALVSGGSTWMTTDHNEP